MTEGRELTGLQAPTAQFGVQLSEIYRSDPCGRLSHGCGDVLRPLAYGFVSV